LTTITSGSGFALSSWDSIWTTIPINKIVKKIVKTNPDLVLVFLKRVEKLKIHEGREKVFQHTYLGFKFRGGQFVLGETFFKDPYFCLF
jgi:hypothetical protein